MKTTCYTFKQEAALNIEEGIIEEGIVYVSDELKLLALKCPCGCNETIMLNTISGVKPCWKAIGNTIKPSIDRTVGCRSHFSIINGNVVK